MMDHSGCLTCPVYRLTGQVSLKPAETQLNWLHGGDNVLLPGSRRELPKFNSKYLDCRACWNNVQLDFIRQGKPTDNDLAEAFNSSEGVRSPADRFRHGCLNKHWFMSLDEAELNVEAWRYEYNGDRPNCALGNLSPDKFVA